MKYVMLAILVIVIIACNQALPENKIGDYDQFIGSAYMGVRVFIDKETGCHYLMQNKGGITPRMNDGKHYCN